MATKIICIKIIPVITEVLFSSILTVLSAQSLVNTSLDLGSGETVCAVDYFNFGNKYIIAGNFNSVNSLARKKIAFLNNNPSLSLSNDQLITSITGNIYCVASHNNYVYIGGNFTSINGQLRKSLARFIYNASLNTWNIDSWNPGFSSYSDGTSQTVYDMEIAGDTLFFAGDFTELDNGNEFRFDQAAIRLTDMSLLPFGSSYYYIGTGSVVYDIRFKKGKIYTAGSDWGFNLSVRRFSPEGIPDNSFAPTWSGATDRTYDLEFYGDTLFLVSRYTSTGTNVVHALSISDGSAVNSALIQGGGGSIHSLAIYKDDLFFISSQTFPAPNNFLGSRNILNSAGSGWNSYPDFPFTEFIRKNVFRIHNHLFVSGNFTDIDGSARNRFAAFCLEPMDPVNFILADTSVCPGQQNVIFSIPPVQYAAGYHWWYTGTGAVINNLSDTVSLTGAASNSISIDFDFNFTSGELMVTPFSECGETSDTLYLSLSLNQLPQISAGNDTSLSCIRTSVQISGFSPSPVLYEWTDPGSFNFTGQSVLISQAGIYFLHVTDSITTCTNTDTVSIFADTIRPDVILPPPPYELTCNDSIKYFYGASSVSEASFNWRVVLNNQLVPDPIGITTPGTYRLIVTDTSNGCVDSLSLMVNINQNLPHSGIVGYTNSNPSVPLDTLTCQKEFIVLEGYSNSPGTIYYWTDSSGVNDYGEQIITDSSGYYYLLVNDTITGCENFAGIFITEYFTAPDLVLPPLQNLNCSNDSLLLYAQTTFANSELTWLTGNTFFSQNPALITNPGTYIACVINLENGCNRRDSLTINFDSLVVVNAGSDTIVCAESLLILTADVLSDDQQISYSWSTGGNSSQENIHVSGDSLITIEVLTSAGCAGYDTVSVSAAAVPEDSVLIFQGCAADTAAQLVIFMNSGLPPFSFSIDGNNFQSDNTFENLYPGNYFITVRDAIQCEYILSTSIGANNLAPEPWFLISTNNLLGDTVVLVNVSIPQPDSIQWLLPQGSEIISQIPHTMIVVSDTGKHSVTLRSFYSSCVIDTTKHFYYHAFDSSYIHFPGLKGIETFIVYPNPNNGNFTIEVSFYIPQNYFITIHDLDGQEHFSYYGLDEKNILLPVSLPVTAEGTYILRIISEYDSQHKYFVISR